MDSCTVLLGILSRRASSIYSPYDMCSLFLYDRGKWMYCQIYIFCLTRCNKEIDISFCVVICSVCQYVMLQYVYMYTGCNAWFWEVKNISIFDCFLNKFSHSDSVLIRLSDSVGFTRILIRISRKTGSGSDHREKTQIPRNLSNLLRCLKKG